MKKLKFLIVAACVAAVCFVLAGCGGNGGGGGDASTEIVGTWELSGGMNGDTPISSEELEAAKQLGMNITFTFSDDGSVVGEMYGEQYSGTWEAVDASTVDITFNGQTQQGTLANGELSITAGDETMTFKKSS